MKLLISSREHFRQMYNLDKIGRFGHIGHNWTDLTISTDLTIWTIWIKLDIVDKVGQFGQDGTFWTELDNLYKIGQHWKSWKKNWTLLTCFFYKRFKPILKTFSKSWWHFRVQFQFVSLNKKESEGFLLRCAMHWIPSFTICVKSVVLFKYHVRIWSFYIVVQTQKIFYPKQQPSLVFKVLFLYNWTQ